MLTVIAHTKQLLTHPSVLWNSRQQHTKVTMPYRHTELITGHCALCTMSLHIQPGADSTVQMIANNVHLSNRFFSIIYHKFCWHDRLVNMLTFSGDELYITSSNNSDELLAAIHVCSLSQQAVVILQKLQFFWEVQSTGVVSLWSTVHFKISRQTPCHRQDPACTGIWSADKLLLWAKCEDINRKRFLTCRKSPICSISSLKCSIFLLMVKLGSVELYSWRLPLVNAEITDKSVLWNQNTIHHF